MKRNILAYPSGRYLRLIGGSYGLFVGYLLTWIGEPAQVRTLGFDPINRMAYVHERGEGIHVLRFNT